MYRRSCGYTAERIDASRRPRIDLRVVELTGGLRTMNDLAGFCLSSVVGDPSCGRRSHVELSRCWCGEASVLPRVRWAGAASSRASERERGGR